MASGKVRAERCSPIAVGRYFWTAWWGCSASLSAAALQQPRRRLQGIKVRALTSSADRKRREERNGGRNEGRRGHGKLVVELLLEV